MPVRIIIDEKNPPVIDDRYQIVREISIGNMAWSYEAVDLKENGQRVFLKYYSSPTPEQKDWYEAYKRYVEAINDRLRHSDAALNCIVGIRLFEAHPTPRCPKKYLFQAFEYVEGGYDLRKRMDAGIDDRDRITMAMLFLQAMSTIHAVGVVHCDLKPENIQMLDLKDPKVQLKWVPRIIDMDRSIIEGVQAPWTMAKIKKGYVGTRYYRSPEHMRGQTPIKGSDVFTVGIILGELLCGRHPFAEYINDGDMAYKDAALKGQFKRMQPAVPMQGSRAAVEAFVELLNRCLLPDASLRPTCTQLHEALLVADRQSDNGGSELSFILLTLIGDKGELPVRLPIPYGKHALSAIDSDAKRYCASGEQFRLLYDRTSYEWFVQPPTKPPKNPTALNGDFLISKTRLRHGDIISLKDPTTGALAMKLKVSLTPQYRLVSE